MPLPKSAVRMTQAEREASYEISYGTKHPTEKHVLPWAKKLFPEVKNPKLRYGLYRLNQGMKIFHLRRWGFLDGNKVLGIGDDIVECVVTADLERKRIAAKRAAESATTQPQKKETTP